MNSYGSEGNVAAFSVGTTSLNAGDTPLWWRSGTNEKPVITQNIYRLCNGRLEHLGQSWLKHGFFALQGNFCECDPDDDGSELGPGCTDPYGAGLNGDQGGMGPKYEINAYEGSHIADAECLSCTGDTIFKRIQIPHADLDPSLNDGCLYFATAQYVSPDDAAAGNHFNNESYRPATVSQTSGSYTMQVTGSTQIGKAAVQIWKDYDSSVTETDIFVPDEGLLIMAAKATETSPGVYRYEYAVQNLNSHQSVQSLTIPFVDGANIFNVGFSDVDYHSGEPYDLTDWSSSVNNSSNTVTWTTDSYASNPNANALRWGTMYNFWFDANVEPGSNTGLASMDLFRPPSTRAGATSVSGLTVLPLGDSSVADCNGNGIDDFDEIANGTVADCNSNSVPDECEDLGSCTVALNQVASGFTTPTYACSPPGDFDRLFVVEQDGLIKILNLGDGSTNSTPFLDLTGLTNGSGERGLLSMAFHPNYASNGKFYVNYTNNSGNTVIAEYEVSSGNPDVANSGSANTIIGISQDFSNHNGGHINFGPDGFLYIGMGDGGSGGDPNNRAQSTSSLLGKMLRLDVDNPSGNYIPADNPYLGSSTRDEIWALGLRNPWRFTFDRLTGDMFIGDVGQDAREEISFEVAGSEGGYNYGWRCYEGDASYNTSGCGSASNYTFPILDYAHSGSVCTVIGGYVYRGCDIPGLQGTYFYAEYCADWIRSFEYDVASDSLSNEQDWTSSLGWSSSNGAIISFAEDAAGELYIVTSSGRIYKFACDGGGTDPVCGNGIVEQGEECDDGNSEAGDGCFNCEFEDLGDNDDCGSAVLVSDGNWPIDTTSATTDGDDHGECKWGGAINDIWFLYEACGTGTLTVSTCSQVNFDTDLHVYEGDNCSTMTLLECQDDTDGCSGYSTTLTTSVSEGEIYTIRVGGWSDDFPNGSEAGTGTITITGPGDSPCNSEPKDCNGNLIDDDEDIASGTSEDCNLNGIPDECDIDSGAFADFEGGPVGNLQNGSIVMAENNCAFCHLPDGSGQTGPNIQNASRSFLWVKLAPGTSHAGGSHELTEQEFADLEAHLSQNGGRGRPDGILDDCAAVLSDCDLDGVSDGAAMEAAFLAGSYLDINYDGLPDDCTWPTCSADFDRDGIVGLSDFSMLLLFYGTPGPPDIAGAGKGGTQPNGVVDLADFSQLLIDWGCTSD
jgi:cysteine-rich repeat protein